MGSETQTGRGEAAFARAVAKLQFFNRLLFVFFTSGFAIMQSNWIFIPFFIVMMSAFGYAFYWLRSGQLDSFPAKDVHNAAMEEIKVPGRVAREMVPVMPLWALDFASVLKPSTIDYCLVIPCLIFGVVVSKIFYNQDLMKVRSR